MEWGEFKTLETRLTVSKRKTQNCICFSYLIWKKVLHLSQGNFFLSTFYLLFIDSISTFDHQVALGCKQAAWGNQNSSCSHLSAFNKVLSIRHSFQWLAFAFSVSLGFLHFPALLSSPSVPGLRSSPSTHPAGFISCLAQLFLHMCLLMSWSPCSHCAVDVKSHVECNFETTTIRILSPVLLLTLNLIKKLTKQIRKCSKECKWNSLPQQCWPMPTVSIQS